MKDKLTKKRVKVDYLLVIGVLNLDKEFLLYQRKNRKIKSVNRLARCFLQKQKVDIDYVYSQYSTKGIFTYEDYLNELIRIANYGKDGDYYMQEAGED